MNYRILLTRLELVKKLDHCVLTLEAGPSQVRLVSDLNLGVIASSLSFGLKCIMADCEVKPRPLIQMDDLKPNHIDLSEYRIVDLLVEPFRWELHMAWRDPKAKKTYTYTAQLERDIESVIAGYAGAMKFFSWKSGLIVWDGEAFRNTEQAMADGFNVQGGTA